MCCVTDVTRYDWHGAQVEYLRKLLRSRHLPASRPKWWERLTIDLGHKGNLNQPLQVG